MNTDHLIKPRDCSTISRAPGGSMNTEHLTAIDARAVEHLTDPLQLHLSERHWGPETPHPHAGGGSR